MRLPGPEIHLPEWEVDGENEKRWELEGAAPGNGGARAGVTLGKTEGLWRKTDMYGAMRINHGCLSRLVDWVCCGSW